MMYIPLSKKMTKFSSDSEIEFQTRGLKNENAKQTHEKTPRKALAMNNAKLVKVLMPEMYERAVQGKCPFCGKLVTTEMFEGRDALTRREFEISGLCPKCQDDFFKEPKE